jgi:hypothetical protein
MAKGLRGQLQVDVADLLRTRGAISVDLSSIEMSSFMDDDKNRRQTADALRWLEVDESEPPDVRDRYRWAEFTIQRITSAEPNDLTRLEGSVRQARIRVQGELSLHGRTVPRDATLAVSFAFEGPVARNVVVDTVEDLHVDLPLHDVRPRDERGKLLDKLSTLYVDAIGETVDVALNLALEPDKRDP